MIKLHNDWKICDKNDIDITFIDVWFEWNNRELTFWITLFNFCIEFNKVY